MELLTSSPFGQTASLLIRRTSVQIICVGEWELDAIAKNETPLGGRGGCNLQDFSNKPQRIHVSAHARCNCDIGAIKVLHNVMQSRHVNNW
jgi:hypothetical protein